MYSYGIYSKVVLKGLVSDEFIPTLIKSVVSIIRIKVKLRSIMLWLIYDCVKLFCVITLWLAVHQI